MFINLGNVNTPIPGERWKFCPSCGTKLGDEWKYCADCGTQVGHVVAPFVIPNQPQVVPLPYNPAQPSYPWTYPTYPWTVTGGTHGSHCACPQCVPRNAYAGGITSGALYGVGWNWYN